MGSCVFDYESNPHWAAMRRIAMKPPNGGEYKRWIQGSVGMMSGMPLYSNEYAHLEMKHGQNNLLSTRGNIKPYSSTITPQLQREVQECSFQTLNPAGCQTAAIQQVYSYDSARAPYRNYSDHYNPVPSITPHPFNVSYCTGYPPQEVPIPPNAGYQT